jgi:hypothetical protein
MVPQVVGRQITPASALEAESNAKDSSFLVESAEEFSA